MHQLELSDEARALEPEAELPVEHRPFPWRNFGRGRGPLLALSVLGLAAFFLPWVSVSRPEDMVLCGFDLARGRAGWLWGGATGFFVLLPLLWTRRTIAQLRGARAIATLFAAMTWLEIAVLLAFPPRRGMIPIEFEWRFGLYTSAALSLIATAVALRLGGRIPHPGTPPTTPPRPNPACCTENSSAPNDVESVIRHRKRSGVDGVSAVPTPATCSAALPPARVAAPPRCRARLRLRAPWEGHESGGQLTSGCPPPCQQRDPSATAG
jgi:hypothetical protein